MRRTGQKALPRRSILHSRLKRFWSSSINLSMASECSFPIRSRVDRQPPTDRQPPMVIGEAVGRMVVGDVSKGLSPGRQPSHCDLCQQGLYPFWNRGVSSHPVTSVLNLNFSRFNQDLIVYGMRYQNCHLSDNIVTGISMNEVLYNAKLETQFTEPD